MSIEKINKEELLNKLGAHVLSDDDLEQVTGGYTGRFIYCADIFETHAYTLCEDYDGTVVVKDSEGTHYFSDYEDFITHYRG